VYDHCAADSELWFDWMSEYGHSSALTLCITHVHLAVCLNLTRVCCFFCHCAVLL